MSTFSRWAWRVTLALFTEVIVSAQTPLPQNFLDCITTGSPGTSCPLPFGTYAIDGSANFPAANIAATGIIVQGVQNGGNYPTLQRTGNVASLMTASGGVNATVQYLNFDGNRYGVPGFQRLGPNAPYWDLNLSSAGTVTVQYVNFINAPGASAIVGGTNSVIQYSTFALDLASQAARSTGLFLQGNGSQALYNYIFFSGTAAINASGTNQWIYGNSLGQNRYEEPDNAPGGQLFLMHLVRRNMSPPT